MKYTYTAVNSNGRKYKGELIADSRPEIMKILQDRGLTALEVNEYVDPSSAEGQKNKSIWEKDIGSKDIHEIKIKKKILLSMCHQMGIMMKAGISLSMAMEILIDTEKNKNLRNILTEINTELYNGIPLSVSMSSFKCFPDLIVNIVQSGESNGHLDSAFEQCAKILQKEMTLSGKIKGAMAYPCFLLGLTIALVIVMTVVVLPQFKDVFDQFGAELPGITKAVMAFSNFLIDYWYIILAVLAVIIITYHILKKNSETFALWISIITLKIPIIGVLMRQTYIARFCNMMSTLVNAGVSILRSLELSRDVISNLYMKDCLNQIIEDVKIGTPINVSMARYPVFDALLVSMVRVGEESGMLAESLTKMADLYEQLTDESTKRLTDAMTPAMTIIIAVVVGTVVVSIVIPMFGMYDTIASS